MRRREGEAKVLAASKRVSGWKLLMKSVESVMERSGGRAVSGRAEVDAGDEAELVLVLVGVAWVVSEESAAVK